MQFLIWLESTPLGVWIRETPSLWGFPFILFLHTLGLAMLAGINVAYMLWFRFFAPAAAVAPLQRMFPVMWTGLAINAISGVLLLLAYPAKALTNPVFYLKLVAIAAALALSSSITRSINPAQSERAQAVPTRSLQRRSLIVIGLWIVAIVTGRLLAYTHSMLLAADPRFY